MTSLTSIVCAPKPKVSERHDESVAATGDQLKAGEHTTTGGEHEMVVAVEGSRVGDGEHEMVFSVEGSRLGGGDAEQWHLPQTDSPASSAGPCRGQAHLREQVSQQEDLREHADLRSSVGPCGSREESHCRAPGMRLARPWAESGSEAVCGVRQALPGQTVALAPSEAQSAGLN